MIDDNSLTAIQTRLDLWKNAVSTPGPWKTSESTIPNVYIIYYDLGPLAVVDGFPRGKDPIYGTNKGNAQLMAVAPELLEILEELVDLIEDHYDGEYDFDTFETEPAKKIIRKARGEPDDYHQT